MYKALYNSLDVAGCIINHAIDISHPVSNLSLQKILYYIQAAFLIKEEQIAFDEPISAWKYGPVVEKVYHEYKTYIDEVIDKKVETKTEISFENDIAIFTEESYNPEENIDNAQHLQIIKQITEAKLKYSPFELVDKTHEEAPWIEATKHGCRYIDLELIKEYFVVHEERIWE